jgi:ATP-dependent DNA ligase
MKSKMTAIAGSFSATTLASACSAAMVWAGRYPWIVESALRNRHRQFVIDGEAVVLGVDGIADFNALHSRQHDDEVQLYAFDILTLDGEDLRGLPLSMRKPTSPAC